VVSDFPTVPSGGRFVEAMDAPLKKIITVHGQQIVMHSLDGEIWSSDLRQLRERERQREKRNAKVVSEAKRFFKNRVGMR
jgi:hypothetical protein